MKLNEERGIPLYYQLKSVLREQIMNNTYKEGEILPSEAEISKIYKVSRVTVREALNGLVAEGLVYRKQGKGTFVAPRKIIPPLEELSFTKQMEAQGLTPISKLISKKELSSAPDHITQPLLLDSSTKIFEIIRLRLANNMPIILEYSYIPSFVKPDLFKIDLSRYPLFKVLSEEFFIERVNTSLESEFPAEHVAKLLEIDSRVPVFCIQQIVYSQRPIALNRRIVRGDKCRYNINFLFTKSSNTKYPYQINIEMRSQSS